LGRQNPKTNPKNVLLGRQNPRMQNPIQVRMLRILNEVQTVERKAYM